MNMRQGSSLLSAVYLLCPCMQAVASGCDQFQAKYAELDKAVQEVATISIRSSAASSPSDADTAALCKTNAMVIEYANALLAYDASCFPDELQPSKAQLSHIIESANGMRALHQCSR